MARLREIIGVLILSGGLAVGGYALWQLRGHDYVAAIVGALISLGLLGSGVELLRPAMGE